MPDWNGDGKDDYHDDYVYHEIFNTRKTSWPARGKSSCGWIWKVLLAMVIWEVIGLIASLR